jgi:hypothetical protein
LIVDREKYKNKHEEYSVNMLMGPLKDLFVIASLSGILVSISIFSALLLFMFLLYQPLSFSSSYFGDNTQVAYAKSSDNSTNNSVGNNQVTNASKTPPSTVITNPKVSAAAANEAGNVVNALPPPCIPSDIGKPKLCTPSKLSVSPQCIPDPDNPLSCLPKGPTPLAQNTAHQPGTTPTSNKNNTKGALISLRPVTNGTKTFAFCMSGDGKASCETNMRKCWATAHNCGYS